MSGILAGLDNQILLEQQTYKLWESAGHKIVEAQLTADQIKQLFANIEQGATAAGGNRTMIGKGKDAAGAVSKAWEDLKNKVYNSGPMNNFAAAYDKQAEKLKQATGGDQGVFKYVQKYRDFAEKHPIIQGFVYSALIAAAGVTGAGLGGAAVLGLFKLTDQLLQGKDIRSAIYQGAKTGALAYGASKLGDLIKGKPEGELPGANVSKLPANVPPDDFNNTYVKGLMKLKGLDPSDPDDQKIWTGWMNQGRDLSTITNVGGNNPSGAAQAAFGGNPNDIMTPWGTMSDEALLKQSYDSAVQEFIKKYAQDPNNPSAQIVKMAKDAAKAKVYGKTMGESLSEATIKILFSKISLEHSKRVDEGIMDTLKGAAGKAMDYAKTKGHNLTTKVTADKLNTAWEKAGKPTDSDKIAEILKSSGVPENVVKDVFAKMKIPVAAAPAQQTPQPNAQAAQQPAASPQPTAAQPAASAAQQPAQKPGAVNKTPPKSNTPVAGTRSQKGAFAYNPLAEGDFEVHVPGFGTVPLEMLKRHVKELTKDFNQMVQTEEFIKAAYRTEQLYNALFALSKAMKSKSSDIDETISTGLGGGSAGIGGGAGLGIEKSPMEKVLEKPLGEDTAYAGGMGQGGNAGQSYRKFTPKSAGTNEEQLDELSPELLARYKKAAGADASKADKEGDFERGNKRFSGIVRATKKEFDKAVKEEQAPMFTPEDKIAGLNDPRSDGWRVYKAVPAGYKESSIMKGLQTEGNVVTWSKDNPPPPQLLLNTLIQILMKPENHKTPQELINLWNQKYGLKHTLGSLRQYAQNDYKKMELSKALQKAALANESSER